jgi:hypothetical protein
MGRGRKRAELISRSHMFEFDMKLYQTPLFERGIGLADFLARPTQTQTT